jgi:hypothetical protein
MVFNGMKTNAYYLMYNKTWTSSTLKGYGGTITWASFGDLLDADITVAEGEYIADGTTAYTPEVTVKVGGKTLTKGTHYNVQYSNNKNAGVATVKVTGIGENKGTASTTFNIVPKKVTGLKQTTTTLKSVKLTWTKQSGITGYKVYKYANSKYTLVKTTTTNAFTISGLKAGTTYTYAVTAYKTSGKTTCEGAKASVKIATLPKTPVMTGKAGTKSAVLTWKKIPGATGYIVYMATSKSGTYKKAATVTKAATVKATIKNLTSKKKYYFKIRAYTKAPTKTVYSAYSKIITVTVR